MVSITWIDIEEQEPKKDQYVFYISEADNLKFHYDDPASKYWCYDFGVDLGIYWKDGLVEDHYDMPMVKIKYWFPTIRFKHEV